MPKRIHLIGLCGAAMATLAAMLKTKGFDVRGSDQNVYPPMSEFLADQQITIFDGYQAEHITADLDLVIVGNAISRGNVELEEVLDRKIRYCSLPEAIRACATNRPHRATEQFVDSPSVLRASASS